MTLYLTKIYEPLGGCVAIPCEGKLIAFSCARSYVGKLVRVYTQGRLIAEKPAGSDRLNHLEVKRDYF